MKDHYVSSTAPLVRIVDPQTGAEDFVPVGPAIRPDSALRFHRPSLGPASSSGGPGQGPGRPAAPPRSHSVRRPR